MKLRNFAILLLAGFTVLTGCRGNKKEVFDNIPVIEKALSDTASAFYADFGNYPADLKDLPIGVFDSGTGGLTVLAKATAVCGILSLASSEDASADGYSRNSVSLGAEP